MKFGLVTDNNHIDIKLPKDHPHTRSVIQNGNVPGDALKVYTGFAKWNRNYLNTFYPKGIGKKDLEYYSTQVNCIEMNAFFYRIFPVEVVQKWYDRSDHDFIFCPKIPQSISQFRQLKDCADKTTSFLESISHFKEKLGSCFLQMHPTFKPTKFKDFEQFIINWPTDVKLTVELRHADWYADLNTANALAQLLEAYHIGHTITDTMGRRDLLHMRMTAPFCFIRFTGTNQDSDYLRIDDWINRLKDWYHDGLKEIYFFVHQNDEHKSMDLYNYFIAGINPHLNCSLNVISKV
ncbi:MAG: hypothetical protein ACI9JN_000908 [Bacteroidia bacterium]|jgi:uncharacterized protein YecE (DUF72 family)